MNFPLFIIWLLWIKFLRVQVQLNSVNENSKKVYAQIIQSNRLQKFLATIMLTGWIAFMIRFFVDNKILKWVQYIMMLVYFYIFCSNILKINSQLAKFFKNLDDFDYPYKSI